MPKYRLSIFKFGGGSHPVNYGVKLNPNKLVQYQEKSHIDEVNNFIRSISDRVVLSRSPNYENLTEAEVTLFETTRKLKLSELEK